MCGAVLLSPGLPGASLFQQQRIRVSVSGIRSRALRCEICARPLFAHRHPEDFRQVQCFAGRALADLLATGEAVGDDESLRRRPPDFREERSLRTTHRTVVVLAALEAESPGHAAAS